VCLQLLLGGKWGWSGTEAQMLAELLKSDFGSRCFRALGFAGWAGIVVLSILPGSARPHSGASGISEHFVAYAAVALCLCLGISTWRNRFALMLCLIASSAIFEIIQIYIPGRTAEFKGLLSSSAGVIMGMLLRLPFHRRDSMT
jgi:hypothetical protein